MIPDLSNKMIKPSHSIVVQPVQQIGGTAARNAAGALGVAKKGSVEGASFKKEILIMIAEG